LNFYLIQHCRVQLLEETELTDDEAAEDVGKSMHEAKQKVKQKLQAAVARSDAAADTLADTALSGLDDETLASAPATARSISTPAGEAV